MASLTGFLGQEYNNFLFAPAAEESDGALLSVLSALARLDLDPWAEAGHLARLPHEAAVLRLAGLLADSSKPAEARRRAAKLIALLPPAGARSSPAAKPWSRQAVVAAARPIILFLLVALGLLIAAQCIARLAPGAAVAQHSLIRGR
jgi:hypothetical protein